jgi:hypothetical protein
VFFSDFPGQRTLAVRRELLETLYLSQKRTFPNKAQTKQMSDVQLVALLYLWVSLFVVPWNK